MDAKNQGRSYRRQCASSVSVRSQPYPDPNRTRCVLPFRNARAITVYRANNNNNKARAPTTKSYKCCNYLPPIESASKCAISESRLEGATVTGFALGLTLEGARLGATEGIPGACVGLSVHTMEYFALKQNKTHKITQHHGLPQRSQNSHRHLEPQRITQQQQQATRHAVLGTTRAIKTHSALQHNPYSCSCNPNVPTRWVPTDLELAATPLLQSYLYPAPQTSPAPDPHAYLKASTIDSFSAVVKTLP